MPAVLAITLAVCLAGASVAAQQPSTPANETATQFYLRYRAAVPAATDLSQIVDYWSADQRETFRTAPPAGRPDLSFVKSLFARATDVEVAKETVTSTAATLEVQGVVDGKPAKATVLLVRENGAWKIASGPERWQ